MPWAEIARSLGGDDLARQGRERILYLVAQGGEGCGDGDRNKRCRDGVLTQLKPFFVFDEILDITHAFTPYWLSEIESTLDSIHDVIENDYFAEIDRPILGE